MKLRYFRQDNDLRLQYFDKLHKEWNFVAIIDEIDIDKPSDFRNGEYPENHNDLFKE